MRTLGLTSVPSIDLRGISSLGANNQDAMDRAFSNVNGIIDDITKRNSRGVLAQLDNASTTEEAQAIRDKALSSGNLDQDAIKKAFDFNRGRIQEQERYNTKDARLQEAHDASMRSKKQTYNFNEEYNPIKIDKATNENTKLEQQIAFAELTDPTRAAQLKSQLRNSNLSGDNAALNYNKGVYDFNQRKENDTNTNIFNNIKANAQKAISSIDFMDANGQPMSPEVQSMLMKSRNNAGMVDLSALAEVTNEPSVINAARAYNANIYSAYQNSSADAPDKVKNMVQSALASANGTSSLASSIKAAQEAKYKTQVGETGDLNGFTTNAAVNLVNGWVNELRSDLSPSEANQTTQDIIADIRSKGLPVNRENVSKFLKERERSWLTSLSGDLINNN